jgi:hypothetical protein
MDRLVEWLPPTSRRRGEGADHPRRLSLRQHDLPPHRAARAGGARLGAVDARPPARRLQLPPDDVPDAAGHHAGLAGLDLPALNIPSEEEYVAAYCRRTGATASPTSTSTSPSTCSGWPAILHGIKGRSPAAPRPSPMPRRPARSAWPTCAATRPLAGLRAAARGAEGRLGRAMQARRIRSRLPRLFARPRPDRLCRRGPGRL